MKRIDDLTHEEVLNLSPEEVQHLIDLECAEEGVPLLPRIGNPPEKPLTQGDIVMFEITGGALRFAKEEEAKAVAELANKFARFETEYTRNYSDPKTVKPEDDLVTIKTETYWTQAHWAVHRTSMEAYARERDAWEKDKKEYTDIEKRRNTLASRVLTIIEDAEEKQARIERIKETFQEYMGLAEGKEEMALAFLRKAGRFREDHIKEALGLKEEKTDGSTEEAN